MDELQIVRALLTEERPASAQTIAAARRRLTEEAAGRRSRLGRCPRPRPRPRARIAVVVVGAATAVTITAGGYYAWITRPLYHPEPLAGYSGPASDFLLAAADAKARHVTDGRLWYTKIEQGLTKRIPSLHEKGVYYEVRVSLNAYQIAAKTEGGLGLRDAGRPRGVSAEGWNDDPRTQPASAADRGAWSRDGEPGASDLEEDKPPRLQEGDNEEILDGRRGPFGGDGTALDFGVTDARRLPADPSKLRAWLLNYATKFDHKRLRDPDLYLFTNASALLIDEPVSDRVRIATYRILASLKGVRMVTATDGTGRTGRAVAMRETTREHGTIEWQLFIDPFTGLLTASQGVIVVPGTDNAGLRPGTRQYYEVVRKAEWTNVPADRLRPEWVRRIDSE